MEKLQAVSLPFVQKMITFLLTYHKNAPFSLTYYKNKIYPLYLLEKRAFHLRNRMGEIPKSKQWSVNEAFMFLKFVP